MQHDPRSTRGPARSSRRVRLRRALWAVTLAAALLLPAVQAPQAKAADPPVISVRDHGARGDGVTDDSNAIQAAVTSVSGPKTVVFPKGTYVFRNIWLKSDTSIVFEAGAQAITPLGAKDTDFFFAAIGSESQHARNISLSGGRFEGRPTAGGVMLCTLADNVTVSRTASVRVKKNTGSDRSSNITVSDCSATDAYWGFAFEESTYVEVVRCRTTRTTRDGILFYGRSRFCSANGNIVDGYSRGAHEGVGGIQVYGSSDATIVNNVVRNGYGISEGIRFRDSNVFWCEGNYVQNPGSTGLAVVRVGDYPGLDGGDGTFVRNTVVGARLRGVDVPSPLSRPVRILDNTILDTKSACAVPSPAAGIRVFAPGCVIVGNEISGCTGVGIHAEGSRQVLADNLVHDPAEVNFGPRVGIFVRGANHAVVGNAVIDDRRYMLEGIRLYTGGTALIRNNTISGFTRASLDIRGTLLSTLFGDSSAPTVSLSEDLGNGSATLVADAHDSGSGVAALRLAVDGGPLETFEGPAARLPLVGVGEHRIECEVIDKAGNVASVNETIFVEGEHPDPGAADVTRVSGADRYYTAADVAREATAEWEGVERLIVASGEDRAAADPLAAAGLCWAYDAPLLLVGSKGAPPAAKSIIDECVAANGKVEVLVVGGPVAVPDKVLDELVAAGSGRVGVSRLLAVGNRYNTAARIALVASLRGGGDVALVANGADSRTFFDALALSALSRRHGFPVLLTWQGSLASETGARLGQLGPATVIVGGGPRSVSDSVRSQIKAQRWSGADRYETAVAIASNGLEAGWLSPSVTGVASRLPDALSGGAHVGSRGGVLLMTRADTVAPATAKWLAEQRADVSSCYVYGGPVSVTEEALNGIRSSLTR